MYIGNKAEVSIGEKFVCDSGVRGTVDSGTCSKIMVEPGANLSIGEHVGMTNCVISCTESIFIGNHVTIGAGTLIFDSDFHSLDWRDRRNGTDIKKRISKKIVIKDFVFIGARSVICKGVTIGEKSIIGAGSVVTKSVPDGEIWGGNPARFLKKIID